MLLRLKSDFFKTHCLVHHISLSMLSLFCISSSNSNAAHTFIMVAIVTPHSQGCVELRIVDEMFSASSKESPVLVFCFLSSANYASLWFFAKMISCDFLFLMNF